MANLNRLKIALIEQGKTGKWLAEQLGKSTCTVSKWCSNSIQPDLNTLDQIAKSLGVDVSELLNKTENNFADKSFGYMLTNPPYDKSWKTDSKHTGEEHRSTSRKGNGAVIYPRCYKSSTRPVKELKGFKQIELQAGECQIVSFEITSEDLKFYNHELEYVFEPGEFEVMIGPNSRDVISASFVYN